MADIHKASSLSPALPVGTTLGNYIIRKVIGSGGYGITYLAQEEITNKLVVIKENYPAEISFRDMTSLIVGPSGESRKEAYDWALTRFLEEAKILSRLSHPNIVPIRNAFKAHGTAYYVMPHVDGTELNKAAPTPDTITAEWLLPVLEKILSALGYLHAQGLIHRDIKPNNILLNGDGEPVLIDFGTARALESTHSHIDTLSFMPFEQLSARGKRGPWTDFYALGATCYYLITGELPPHSVDRMEEDEYLPLAGNPSLTGRFPEHVLSSIDKALRINRSKRWQSAQEWLDALKDKPAVTSVTIEADAQAVDVLERLGISSDTYNDNLLSAAVKGETYMTALLLAAGADVNVADDYGVTPLDMAATNGHTDCVRLLLAAPGIDVNEESPLSCAASRGHTDCVRLLLAAPGIDVNKGAPLSCAAASGHTECVNLLLNAPGININQADWYGATPLSNAAVNGHTEYVLLLLGTPGIDVNKENARKETPLLLAANKNHTECMRFLLATPGIDVNKADHNGWTPLHWAAYKGQKECVRLLLASPKIDVNKENLLGKTPLYWAVENNHTECAYLIRAAGGK